MNKLKIAWLFPDTLYLHGERGNIIALQRFASMAGLQVETSKIDFNTKNFQPMDFDIIFCPPGEISSFPIIIEWMMPFKEKLTEFVNSGRPLIVTGTSVGIWGKMVKRCDGTEFSALGLISTTAVENKVVYGDDNYFTCSYNHTEMEIIGNQIQMVDFINEGELPFGHLQYGYGNTGKDRDEGFIKSNSIFTNTLAPLLVANPKLTMEIIKVSAANQGIDIPEFNYDMELEEKSFETKKEFIRTKESRLTNCK